MNKEKIIIAAEKERIGYHRFAEILSEGFIAKELYVVLDPNNPPMLLIRLFSSIKNWRKVLKKFKPDKIIICGGALISIWIIIFWVRLFKLKIEIISFRYDIEYFRPYPIKLFEKLGHFISRKLEKFCLIRSDKIIHKGLKNEWEFLPFYRKIKDKPHYLLREFLDKHLIQKYNLNRKLSKKDGQIHVVYGGGWHFRDDCTSDSFFKLHESLLKNKCHVHLYTKISDNRKKKILEDFENKYPNFHYEGYISHNKFIEECTKYDFGTDFNGFLKQKNSIFVKTVFSNKNFDYIAAKLPILTNMEAEAKSVFVVNNEIGFSFNLNEYNKASVYKKLSDKKKYREFIRNIGKFINKYDNKKLVEFIRY